ncbi:MAG: hypothetical protein V1685_06995 [Parcubacteria group bacterium]
MLQTEGGRLIYIYVQSCRDMLEMAHRIFQELTTLVCLLPLIVLTAIMRLIQKLHKPTYFAFTLMPFVDYIPPGSPCDY